MSLPEKENSTLEENASLRKTRREQAQVRVIPFPATCSRTIETEESRFDERVYGREEKRRIRTCWRHTYAHSHAHEHAQWHTANLRDSQLIIAIIIANVNMDAYADPLYEHVCMRALVSE